MLLLPLFPLNIVVFPHEDLNLKIFEPRYKQLINECLEQNSTFGIPSYFNNKLQGYGTEMMVTQLVRTYPNGEMDIRTKGLRIFRIVDFHNPMEGKLYAGGEISYVNHEEISEEISPKLLNLVEKFYLTINTPVNYLSSTHQPFSFRVAHKIGLSMEEEYKLLTTKTEQERQKMLIIHLEKIIPIMQNIEKTKARIALNGHFKETDFLNF